MGDWERREKRDEPAGLIDLSFLLRERRRGGRLVPPVFIYNQRGWLVAALLIFCKNRHTARSSR